MSYRREMMGIFVENWENMTPGRLQSAYANGARWILVQCHADIYAPPNGHPSLNWMETARRIFGKDQVGGWGAFGSVAVADPRAVARAANGAIIAYEYPFYCANIEIRMDEQAFLSEFRKHQPSLTLWLSSEITGATVNRAWNIWFGKGHYNCQCWLPQCYLNVDKNLTPLEAMFWATRPIPPGYGIPRQMVKPTIGLYDVSGKRYPIQGYIDQLSQLHSPGFSAWLGETATTEESERLGHAIRTRGIAKLV